MPNLRLLPANLPEAKRPDAAADWIDANQLGRRNLTPDQYSLLRGRRYNRTKKIVRNPEGRNQTSEVSPQNEAKPKTAESLAKQHGVSKATIERDGQFAAAVEKVKAIDPKIEAKVVRGETFTVAAAFTLDSPSWDASGKFAGSVFPGAVWPCACLSFASASNRGLILAPINTRLVAAWI